MVLLEDLAESMTYQGDILHLARVQPFPVIPRPIVALKQRRPCSFNWRNYALWKIKLRPTFSPLFVLESEILPRPASTKMAAAALASYKFKLECGDYASHD